MSCRSCDSKLRQVLDLGNQPIANSLLTSLSEPEMTYPLIFSCCTSCGLYQTEHNLDSSTIFKADYPYFSSIGKSYVVQCEALAKKLIKECNPKSVLEIGCNDGYMLENFRHLEHLGIDPCDSVASIGRSKGLHIETGFFGSRKFGVYDLIIANNVLAHVPELNGFIEGIRNNLSNQGVAIVEVPNTKTTFDQGAFDQIYHEHYSYFTRASLAYMFHMHGMAVVRMEDIQSHGGSLRAIFRLMPSSYVEQKEFIEEKAFLQKTKTIKFEYQQILNKLKDNGNNIIAYGAAAKGNVFLNYLGIKSDIIDYCVDETPAKQGKYLPGSRIPILSPFSLEINEKPDYCLILPWNFREEISEKIPKSIQILSR